MARALALIVGAAAVVAVVTTGPPAAAATYPTTPTTSYLGRGQILHAGQALFSDLGRGVELAMQTDGDLVLSVPSARRVLWSTRTSGAGNTVQMQTDGNVVVRSSTGAALWSTGTVGTGASVFAASSNGTAVLAGPHGAVWTSPNVPAATNGIVVGVIVSPNGHYRALMQTDGNFVVSSASTGALWSSGTAGHPGALLQLQIHDGNLVIYGPSPLWSSGTSGAEGFDLAMQDDGNLVLYKGVDHTLPVWSTHTAGRP